MLSSCVCLSAWTCVFPRVREADGPRSVCFRVLVPPAVQKQTLMFVMIFCCCHSSVLLLYLLHVFGCVI